MKKRVLISSFICYNYYIIIQEGGILKKKNWGGYRKGAGRSPLDKNDKKKGAKIYITDFIREDIEKYGSGNSFSEKVVNLIICEIKNRKIKDELED